jgi:hypothetical protein
MEAGRNIGNNDNAGSYTHGRDNTAEVGGGRIDGDIEGENGDSRFPTSEKPSDETVLGKSFLEPRLLCHTVGMDEEKTQRYVKYQEDAERLSEDHELQEGLF